MSPSHYVSCSQVPFDTCDSMGGAGLPASGCLGSVLPDFEIYKANLETHRSATLVRFAVKNWMHKATTLTQSRTTGSQKAIWSLVCSPQREAGTLVYFVPQRQSYLTVCATKPGGQGLFQHHLNDLFGTFQRKNKNSLLTLFNLVKSKNDKICRGGSLSENTPSNRDHQEDFLRAPFWRVSRDKSLLWNQDAELTSFKIMCVNKCAEEIVSRNYEEIRLNYLIFQNGTSQSCHNRVRRQCQKIQEKQFYLCFSVGVETKILTGQ